MNRLVLAAAGGRKTQAIVEECCAAEAGKRILVLTYTQANQWQLRDRIAQHGPPGCHVDVQGWFSFLLGHWVRPYLPMAYPGHRLRGFSFDGDPGRFSKGRPRFLDSEDRAYRLHLARLACDVNAAAGGAVLRRLADIYDFVYIDEVQDLNGWDLEVLEALLLSPLMVKMVGDVRQAILATNPRETKNKHYKGAQILAWFKKQESKGRLEVQLENRTWRSTQTIADLAHSAVEQELDLPALEAQEEVREGHAGIFRIEVPRAEAYAAQYGALCLRSRADTGGACDLPYVTIGSAKGLEADHVLIWPTKPMVEFLRGNERLKLQSACALYVAITRARASVGFIADGDIGLPVWAGASD